MVLLLSLCNYYSWVIQVYSGSKMTTAEFWFDKIASATLWCISCCLISVTEASRYLNALAYLHPMHWLLTLLL